MKDIVEKVFISVSFSIASYKQGMRKRQVTLTEKPQMKINILRKQKDSYPGKRLLDPPPHIPRGLSAAARTG